MQITFLGQSAYLFSHGEHALLVDPFLMDNPAAPDQDGLRAGALGATPIALPHGHDAHTSDAVGIAKRTGATVIAAYELANHIGAQGIDAVEPGAPGGSIKAPFGSVTFTQAVHSSSTGGQYMGPACGLIIEMDGKRVYHAGDTALFSDMALIGELYSPHIAIVPIGDRFTMNPEHASRAVDLVKPSMCAIPCHYNTWPLIEVDVARFKPTSAEVRVLEPGESMNL